MGNGANGRMASYRTTAKYRRKPHEELASSEDVDLSTIEKLEIELVRGDAHAGGR